MALADLDTVKKRLIALLNANPGTWSASVSGSVGAFPSDSEITQACLEADSNVACQGYANSVNDSLANPFQVTTAPFADRDTVPFHHGDLSKVEVSTSNENFTTISIANQIPLTAHGLTTGQLVSLQTTGTLPTGLAIQTNYYVIVISASIISLASSLKNALAGTAVAITISTGSGTHTVIAWSIGVQAANIDDITNAAVMEAYVGAGSYSFLYFPADGLMYTRATYWRATHFQYTQTATLQCDQNESSLLIFEAAAILMKNASPALFQEYKQMADQGIQQLVSDGLYSAQEQSQIANS